METTHSLTGRQAAFHGGYWRKSFFIEICRQRWFLPWTSINCIAFEGIKNIWKQLKKPDSGSHSSQHRLAQDKRVVWHIWGGQSRGEEGSRPGHPCIIIGSIHCFSDRGNKASSMPSTLGWPGGNYNRDNLLDKAFTLVGASRGQ